MGGIANPRNKENNFSIQGCTYRFRWHDRIVGEDFTFYITINHVLRTDDSLGETVWSPYEIFINSKNATHFALTTALTRMISAVFRRTCDIKFIADELQEVFEGGGAQEIDGEWIKSIPAAIGKKLQIHLTYLDKLNNELLFKPQTHKEDSDETHS